MNELLYRCEVERSESTSIETCGPYDSCSGQNKTVNHVAQLSAIFAGLAIFISCMGLFGLAAFMAERRTKEIGIRKVLGASVPNLWMLLSKEFILLVVIACLIASPIAYLLMNSWLQLFDYRINIGIGILLS